MEAKVIDDIAAWVKASVERATVPSRTIVRAMSLPIASEAAW